MKSLRSWRAAVLSLVVKLSVHEYPQVRLRREQRRVLLGPRPWREGKGRKSLFECLPPDATARREASPALAESLRGLHFFGR